MSSAQQTLRCLERSDGCQTGKQCDVDSPSAPSLTAVRRTLPLAEISRSGAPGIAFFRLTAQRRACYGSFGKAESPRSKIPSTKVVSAFRCFSPERDERDVQLQNRAAQRCRAVLLGRRTSESEEGHKLSSQHDHGVRPEQLMTAWTNSPRSERINTHTQPASVSSPHHEPAGSLQVCVRQHPAATTPEVAP